ncbi:MAG: hypothetical protein ACRCVN_03405 [Spirochaetia bacterium]
MYFHRSRRHFIIFLALMIICFLRTSFFERLLKNTFLLPLQNDDIILFSCALFLLFFLYFTGVGYAFEGEGIRKKYPFFPATLYPAKDIIAYEFVNKAAPVWIFYLENSKKKMSLIIPGYFPRIKSEVDRFIDHHQITKMS